MKGLISPDRAAPAALMAMWSIPGWAFAVPKGVPQPIVAKLNAELIRISQIPAVREKMNTQDIDMMPPEPPAAVERLVRDDLALWVPIIKASGASAE